VAKKIIVTAIDNNPHYMEGLKVFLASFAVNAPGEQIRVYLMNCTPKYQKEIMKIYPVQALLIRTSETSAYRRSYIRHEKILELFNEGYDTVAWIDNDAIVRKPLDGFWDGVGPGVIKVTYRSGKSFRNKFQAGIHILGESDKVRKYLENIITCLEDANDWKLPQALMYVLAGTLKHVDMEEKYNDSRFKNDSVIWHCKNTHFDEPRYQKEYRKYCEIAHV